MARWRHGRDDSGAVVVLVAGSMGALVIMLALVLDLSGARRDRESDQTAADAMAAAAAANLGAHATSAEVACLAAWDYLVVNLPTAATAPAPDCNAFDASCDDSTTARTETAVMGDYTVTFTHPVPDGHDLLAGQPSAASDGVACERFGVRVQQDRANLWAAGSIDLDVDAVGRYLPGVGDVIAPFVLLEPHQCGALVLGGNAELHVSTSTGEDGYVAVDSDGEDCGDPDKVIFDIEGNAEMTAGVISMYALADGTSTGAYTPGLDLDPPPVASSAPVGRTGMDWRYDCKPENGCPGSGPAHITDLVAAYGEAGDPAPAGFTTWTAAGYSCSPSSNLVVPAGNWYINCPGGLSTNRSITFQGGDLVTEGPISATGSGGLRINCTDGNTNDTIAPATCPADPPSPGIFYQRSGNLSRTGNTVLELHETFVYLADGTLNLAGNTDLVWTAPDDPSHPFDDLLVWTESVQTIELTGNSQLFLEGILFMPNAHLSMSGNTSTDAIDAQIFTRTAEVTGNSILSFRPSSDRTYSVGKGRVLLIR